MRLSELKTGQSATILNVLGHGGFRRRIMEMGFVRGKRVDVLQNAPLRDPIKYRIMDYEVSLRRSEAAMIVVITAEEVQQQLSVAGETLSAPDDADFEEAIVHAQPHDQRRIDRQSQQRQDLAVQRHFGRPRTCGQLQRGHRRRQARRHIVTKDTGSIHHRSARHLRPLGLYARRVVRAPPSGRTTRPTWSSTP